MNFLITNRATKVGKDQREVIVRDGREPALPTFRCGELHPIAGPVPYREEIYPDERIADYADVGNSADSASLKGSARLFRRLYEEMSKRDSDGKGDLLIFIHGFNYTFEDSLHHIRELEQTYVEPPDSPISHLLYVSWPSLGRVTGYRDDRRDARETGRMLARVFSKAQQFFAQYFVPVRQDGRLVPKHRFCGRRMHLAAHSMGNQVLENALGTLFLDGSDSYEMFAEVLLLHADVAWDVLEPGMGMNRLPSIAGRTHVYNSWSDDVLSVSAIAKNGIQRLGRNGPRSIRNIPDRIVVLDCSNSNGVKIKKVPSIPFVKGERVMRISENEPTKTKETLFDHWGYLYRPAVIADIKAVLSGKPAAKIENRTVKQAPNLLTLR